MYTVHCISTISISVLVNFKKISWYVRGKYLLEQHTIPIPPYFSLEDSQFTFFF